jgi:hypothetical protein
MSITVMKQALEALEMFDGQHTAPGATMRFTKTITSLRQAIEQAEKQEPVAKVIDWGVEGPRLQGFTKDWPRVGTLLYTSPPPRQPLTDEQIERLEAMCIDPIDSKGWGFLNRKSFARAIEAAHGIKGEA